MQLKTYNTESVPHVKRGVAPVRINRKTGLFSFTKIASEKMGLTDGALVEFHQDEARPKDWYIEVKKDGNGFQVRDKKAHGQHSCNSVGLCTVMFTALEFEGNSAAMNIGEPIEVEDLPRVTRKLFAIITKSIRK